jgi:TRAP-type mannitol/chloroaromatic compound transport system permease large subunit
MGAVGALALATARRKLNWSLAKQALNSTAKLSSFVIFVLIGSTIFSLTFQGIDGPKWVEHLFDKLPGGQLGFLVVVNVLIFVLGCFLDFFEIAFILLPLLAPVADKLDIDLVWFGIIIAMNLQTSFLTPPFGFALFYSAQRGAGLRLHRPGHSQDHSKGHDRQYLSGFYCVCDPSADHAGGGYRIPVPDT